MSNKFNAFRKHPYSANHRSNIAATYVTFQLRCRNVTMLLQYCCNDLRCMDVYERR